MKKLTLKQHCLIGNLIVILGVILAIIGFFLRQGDQVHFLAWIALALVLVSVFYKMMTLRCPHCDGGLPARYKVPKTCPHCGKSTEVTEHEEADR